jgi:DNA primase
VRPIEGVTISMPFEWEIIDQILPTDFTLLNTTEKIVGKNDIRKLLLSWFSILDSRQDIAKLLDAV